MHAGHLRRLDDRRRRRVAEAGDVLAHRAGEQLDVLRQVAEVAAESSRSQVCSRRRRAAPRRVRRPDADQEPRQGRLAGGRGADDRQRLAGLELEADRPQGRRVGSGIGERDALHAKLAVRRRQRHPVARSSLESAKCALRRA